MKITPLNPPSEREREALTILQEECSEVIKEVSKILRFGWDSHHPNDPSTTNRNLLEEEVGQLSRMIRFMKENDYLDNGNMARASEKKVEKLKKYSSLYDTDTQ
jgi:hypothetical protein